MSEKKEKKPGSWKKKLSALAVSLVFIIAFAALGVLLGAYANRIDGGSDAKGFAVILGGLLMLYLAFLLQIILHEGGHMVFGLLTGYKFVSFNVLGFIWTRGADGKLRRGRMQIAGAGGQCLMAPPDYNVGRFPYTLYNLGGVLANLIVSAVCFLLAIPAADIPALFLFLMEMGLVGVIFAALNGLPLPVAAIQNDGKNQLCISKDEAARRAFWVQMTVAAESARGTRLKHMPEEWFRPFPEKAMDNPIVSAISVMSASRLMDRLDFESAESAIRALLAREKGIVDLYRMALACDGATCELIAGRPADLTEMLSTKENRQMMKAMKTNPAILRTLYALALLEERNGTKAEKILQEFEKAAEKYPNQQDVIGEREILLAIQNAALNGGLTAQHTMQSP